MVVEWQIILNGFQDTAHLKLRIILMYSPHSFVSPDDLNYWTIP